MNCWVFLGLVIFAISHFFEVQKLCHIDNIIPDTQIISRCPHKACLDFWSALGMRALPGSSELHQLIRLYHSLFLSIYLALLPCFQLSF